MEYRNTFFLECAEDFDLNKILKNEPFAFFFGNDAKRCLHVFGRDVFLELDQKEDGKLVCHVRCRDKLNGNMLDFIKNRLEFCLGCREKLDEFYALVKNDGVLSRFYDRIYGTRALAFFDSFEAIFAIICSQNVSFNTYKKMLLRVVSSYGLEDRLPTWAEVLENPHLLENSGVGYRATYILEAARFFSRVDRFALPEESRLKNMKGVGNYTTTLFYLLQGRDYSRFYVDVLMRKIFAQHYNFVFERDAELERYAKRRFGKYSGLAGLYLQQFLREEK